MEIEKRKQAEESLNDMRNQWQRIRQQLAQVGLTLPADPIAVAEEGEQPNIDPAEEICRQVYLARFVSESVGRGIAKAEMEAQMEAQIETKNFEIARLWDRLHYYEAMNREMSQRNQEAVGENILPLITFLYAPTSSCIFFFLRLLGHTFFGVSFFDLDCFLASSSFIILKHEKMGKICCCFVFHLMLHFL